MEQTGAGDIHFLDPYSWAERILYTGFFLKGLPKRGILAEARFQVGLQPALNHKNGILLFKVC